MSQKPGRFEKAALHARRGEGFTLIEVMIVVAVIGILAAIAYPSFIDSVTKSNRAAAKSCLLEHANAMERFYTTNMSYYRDTAGTVLAAPAPLACDTANNMATKYVFSYSVAPTAAAPNRYTLQAVPQGVQAVRDTKCGTLTVDQAGTRTNSGSGSLTDCW